MQGAKDETRTQAVSRLIGLLEEAEARGCELVVFPELALTTFFPRWVMPIEYADEFYEREMPNDYTQPLWDEAARQNDLKQQGEIEEEAVDAQPDSLFDDEKPEAEPGVGSYGLSRNEIPS